ncbi:hypothetical protein [Cereibacter changlensis]|uniref:hypothetical protein n=1 Tax=Cereibacter changlensis TaxID=402884 RepID=UPI0011B25822|nr:hypothetical protein [Cereibacter changlensis]
MSRDRRDEGPAGNGGGGGSPSRRAQEAALREERLKAALKANMARRKAQARVRREGATADGPDADGPITDGEDPTDHNQTEE